MMLGLNNKYVPINRNHWKLTYLDLFTCNHEWRLRDLINRAKFQVRPRSYLFLSVIVTLRLSCQTTIWKWLPIYITLRHNITLKLVCNTYFYGGKKKSALCEKLHGLRTDVLRNKSDLNKIIDQNSVRNCKYSTINHKLHSF